METLSKVVRVGTISGCGKTPVSLFCKIKLQNGLLSISGVEGPTPGGNCRGACGQIVMHDWKIANYAPGWNAALVSKFRAVWNRHHLNDMKAGSPAQERYLREHPLPRHTYEAACESLAQAGLNPDLNYMRNDQPYSYGSAWLREELPQDVIDFLKALPDADKAPAWV